ncbi:hypothetical protein [Nocardia sp. NBC_01009]|uniref:hypothetical protein n=1 Tax=Nocardia sp. NBC_01009 TaxID=2975996 RepID=UPI003863BB2D|nr:hypothetical protein OHA42_26005 [Nocardia sp. NBC_01009]
MDTVAAAPPESEHGPRPASAAAKLRFSATLRDARPVVVVAGCLIMLQLLLRWWVVSRGYFYWDDLILVGRADRYPLWSTDLLLYNHDGHFMPLAFATAWVVTAVAPLAWAGPVVSLLILQLAASVAVLRMLIVLVGARWTILVPLLFYLFCPLTLPAFAWWAAALNALPLQFALAWVIGDAVLLVRSGRHRYAISAIVAFAVALLYFEKSAIVPFVAFAVAALAQYVDGRAATIRVVARRGAALWTGSGLVLACWFMGYLTVVDVSALHNSLDELRNLLPRATSLGIVPTLLGGPWIWERWLPSTPWADPPGWAVVSAWGTLGVVVVLSMLARLRVVPVWLTAAAYILVAQLPVALARSGPNTAAEIMQSLRYFADMAVVLAAVGALVLRARPRPSRGRLRTLLPGPRAAGAVLVVFLVSSLWSTHTFVRSWRAGPTRTYVTNVKSALDELDNAPLLEQEVPWNVLNPLAYPQNLASRVLAPVASPGTFAASTPHLRMITDTGEIVEAAVWWNRSIRPGPEANCGYRIHGTAPVELLLDGPMLEHEWTAQLNYLANRDGRITVAFEHGESVAAPVRKGLNAVFVRIVGGGSVVRIASRTTGLDLCIGSGPVGVASYDN